MATLHPSGDGAGVVYVKGSVENVLAMSSHIYGNGARQEMTEENRLRIESINQQMASQALRVMAVAYGECTLSDAPLCMGKLDGKLTLVALAAMIDPPREEAKEAIAACKRAGMKVVMITGDQKITAVAIAEQLGLPPGEAVTGPELAHMSDEELKLKVEDISVFARVEPLQKLRIVTALKSRGHVLAMTGYGVNDAPALRAPLTSA